MLNFFTIALLALAFGNLVAYFSFVSLFPSMAKKNIWITRLIFVILFSSFFLARAFPGPVDAPLSSIFYTASAVWMGFLLYIFMAGILYGVIWTIAHFTYPGFSPDKIGKMFMIIAVFVGIYGLYNANTIKVTEFVISIPNLPESWNGRKAVFMADIHLGPVHKSGFTKKIAEKVRELEPDIIFDAGDLYDGGEVNAVALIEPFRELNPPLGYYFVTGNHEEYGDTSAFIRAIKDLNINILNNEGVEVDGVWIMGADYATTRSAEGFSFVLDEIMKNVSMPSILIKHVPLDLDVAEKYGIDIQLSGHTHRAQLWPLSYITSAVYDGYDYGLKKLGDMQVLVTDGVGTWGPPLRVGTNSEIVLIRFE